jgi:hypothetical protein
VRRSHYCGLVLGLALVLTSLAIGARPAVAQGLDEGEGLVLAFFHAGYGFNSWMPQLCDLPLHLYDSSSSEAISRQIGQAQEAGINGFVQVWYGPELVQNPTETNLITLLDRAETTGFKVAVLVDMTGDFLKTATDVEAALVALRDRHSVRGVYLTVSGRPVVFFLGQDRRLTISQWEALRSKVDPDRRMIWIAEGDTTAFLGVFDGLYLFDLAQSTQIATLLYNTSSRVKMWNFGQATPAYWVATVIPGYDDSAVVVTPSDVLHRARSGGQYYRENWDAAMDSDPAWILVRSFNEWRYCTHIEPSIQYGTDYLERTAELIDRYRESLLPPTPAPTATDAAPVVSATDTPEPTLDETTVVTPTVTLEPTVTETPTPTLTLTPSATPFRLATPTPSPLPGEARSAAPTGTLPPGANAALPKTSIPGMERPAWTPAPRLPVEGSARRRCTLLPLWLPAGALWLARRRRSR